MSGQHHDFCDFSDPGSLKEVKKEISPVIFNIEIDTYVDEDHP